MSNISELDKAYAAGLFQGEGSVFAGSRKAKAQSWVVTVNLVNADYACVLWLQEKFGGNLTLDTNKKKNPKWRETLRWYMSARKAKVFLQAILPYLVGHKKAQAELAIELQGRLELNTTHSIPLSEEELAIRRELAHKIQLLKRIQDVYHPT